MSTCLDQKHNEDEYLSELYCRWNHEGLYKDYDLGGFIEFAGEVYKWI
jgi:hypothetical protein